MNDAQRSLLYVSSHTAEVVMAAPQWQRYWNFVGAWLHWLYMFRSGSSDPVWAWLLIVLSTIGTLSVLTGMCSGLWRWRFHGHYKNGRHTPFRDTIMRWHHITGLCMALVLLSWVFSGLMAMNPAGLFSPAQGGPNVAAYRQGQAGGAAAQASRNLSTQQALNMLHGAGLQACELHWKMLSGTPYLLAYDCAGQSRLIVPHAHDTWVVQEQWPQTRVLQAAQRLHEEGIRTWSLLHDYDTYYYARSGASMYAANPRPLPVLQVNLNDYAATQVYIDPRSGDIVHSVDRSQRVGRWLFNFLHSWDVTQILRMLALRDALIIMLSLGMCAVALTGCIIGTRRLLSWYRQQRTATAATTIAPIK